MTHAPAARNVVSYPGEPAKARDNMLKVHPMRHLHEKPQRIYRETIAAYKNEPYTLAAGGLRAIVEAICLDKAIQDGPVEERIRRPATAELYGNPTVRERSSGWPKRASLPKSKQKCSMKHRFMGNNALHDLEMPDPDNLKIASAIIEHTLETIYELEHQGAALKAARGGSP